MKKVTILLFLIFISKLFASSNEFLGPVMRNAFPPPDTTYELIVSPLFLTSIAEPVHVSELRYQIFSNLNLAASLGVWTKGFSLGFPFTWFYEDDSFDPQIAILFGPYFEWISDTKYVSLRFAPFFSKSFYSEWGEITPYLAFEVTPSLYINNKSYRFLIKSVAGLQFALDKLEGLRFSTELGFGITNTFSYFAIGISYPFFIF